MNSGKTQIYYLDWIPIHPALSKYIYRAAKNKQITWISRFFLKWYNLMNPNKEKVVQIIKKHYMKEKKEN